MKKQTILLIIIVIVLIGFGIYKGSGLFLSTVVAPVVMTPTVSYTNATSDNISIQIPLPGDIVAKTITVMGKARGPWYFEATFPILVLDARGKVLVTSFAQAQGDWMTTDFVPFVGQVIVPDSYTGKATIILKKDNPSDLRENDASVSFLVTIR